MDASLYLLSHWVLELIENKEDFTRSEEDEDEEGEGPAGVYMCIHTILYVCVHVCVLCAPLVFGG